MVDFWVKKHKNARIRGATTAVIMYTFNQSNKTLED